MVEKSGLPDLGLHMVKWYLVELLEGLQTVRYNRAPLYTRVQHLQGRWFDAD